MKATDTTNNTVTLASLKQGDFFTLKPNGPVWVRDGYDRSTRKYGIHKFDDTNHWAERKGTTPVFTEFTF